MGIAISLGSYEISAVTDHVDFGDLQISAQARVTKPLRATDGTPTPDGGTTARWTIIVTREHANANAALAFLTDLPGEVAALSDVTASPTLTLVMTGFGTWPNAAVQAATCRRKGVTTFTTWEILTSPTPTPPPPP